MNEEKLKILELFSGIGGMHYAFKYSKLFGEICAAVDINPIANSVYKHNFPEIQVFGSNIQKLTPKQIMKMNVNMILMSPPCQPFTRVGKQKDLQDSRTDAFKYICDILIPNLETIDFILMENVKGFEKSNARDLYVQTLHKSGFFIREFLLSPTHFGIPNSRYRYYCLARRKKDFSFEQKDLYETLSSKITKEPFKISEILENVDNLDKYYLPDDLLQKRIAVMDIVVPESTNSCCFTKAYTHYSEGTGSVLSLCENNNISEVLEMIKIYKKDSKEYLDRLKELKLRYFTPKEVSRLMSFPEEFKFPSEITNRQKYKLLGNSINVLVFGELIKVLCQ